MTMKKDIICTNNGLKRIAIAISGGVDSSVAAYLLQNSFGPQSIFGLHMTNWNASDEDSNGNYCEQSQRDAHDAKRVCDSLGIEMQRVDFVSEYWNGVFEPFVKALGEQRMVNPDVGCNTIVKFGVMREYAMKKGASHIATGHYARLWHRNRNRNEHEHEHEHEHDYFEASSESNRLLVESCISGLPEEEWICNWGRKSNNNDYGPGASNPNLMPPLLLSGADLNKDQSYFLCCVKGMALSNAIFPLGNLTKKNAVDDGYNNSNMYPSNSSIQNSTLTLDAQNDSHDLQQFQDMNNMNNMNNMTVREIATKVGLPTATKKESMGICFVGKRKFGDFITQYLPQLPEPGDFIDIDTGQVS
jgi:tRNA U34 2-thiouridine synthase MnmA/TrmU